MDITQKVAVVLRGPPFVAKSTTPKHSPRSRGGRLPTSSLTKASPHIAARIWPKGVSAVSSMRSSKAADCRAKLRQLLSMAPLHATGPARPQGAGVVQVAHAEDSIVAQTADGDIHINQKKVVRPQITRERGDITEETAHAIQDLIRQLAQTDEFAGKEASYGEWQQRLKNRFKVESYRKLKVDQGKAAIEWLRQELGRKTPSLRRTNNAEWRKRMYAGTPRLAAWGLSVLCWPREFKPDEGCAATANVVWLVIPSGIGVAQAVAHQRTAARIAGSGTVGPPVLAKHGVLDKVEQGGFAGAERSRD